MIEIIDMGYITQTEKAGDIECSKIIGIIKTIMIITTIIITAENNET